MIGSVAATRVVGFVGAKMKLAFDARSTLLKLQRGFPPEFRGFAWLRSAPSPRTQGRGVGEGSCIFGRPRRSVRTRVRLRFSPAVHRRSRAQLNIRTNPRPCRRENWRLYLSVRVARPCARPCTARDAFLRFPLISPQKEFCHSGFSDSAPVRLCAHEADWPPRDSATAQSPGNTSKTTPVPVPVSSPKMILPTRSSPQSKARAGTAALAVRPAHDRDA